MNNITLNASNEMHRKIADCFRGCKTIDSDDLIGSYLCKFYNRIEFVIHIPKENEFIELQEITIDLDTCQPCIYTAMKHRLRVGIEFEEDKAFSYDFRDLGDQAESLCDMIKYKIKSIKILDLEKMDGVKEKVGEE